MALIGRAVDGLKSSAELMAALGSIGLVGGTLLVVWVPELAGFAAVTLGISVVLVLAAAGVSWKVIARSLVGRSGRLSTNGLATVALVVGLVMVINMVAQASGPTWDLTATRFFELSGQTITVLESLETPVEIVGFAVRTKSSHQQYQARTERLLEAFAKRTNQLTFRFVDPQLAPSVAREYGAAGFPALVIVGIDGQRRTLDLVAVTEQRLMSAILSATRMRQHHVYFITGHGERNSADLREESLGYGRAARGMRDDGYFVESLNLIQEGGVPEDASALVIAAPQGEMAPSEQDALIAWLSTGGRAVVLLEPGERQPATAAELLATWGLQQVRGTIVDPARSAASDPRALLVQSDGYVSSTVITEPLGPTLFPSASAFQPLPAVQARIEARSPLPVRFEPIANSTQESWASLAGDRDVFVDGEDQPGPHTLHLIVQASDTITSALDAEFDPSNVQTTLVLFGDADFASNRHFDTLGNRDLFLNAVNWVLADDSLIAIRPKTEVFRPLVLTVNEFNLIRYVAWFLLPAMVAAGAVVSWWRQR